MDYTSVLKKRAEGYYYTEEVVEYERGRKSKYLFCRKHHLVYIGCGYIKIKPINITSRTAKFDYKKYRLFSKRFRKRKKYILLQK